MVWGGADALRRLLDAAKWPFERALWALERGLVWPLEERTGRWTPQVRTFGIAVLALLAAGAGVLGLLWASGGGGNASQVAQPAAPAPAPIVRQAPVAEPAPETPALRGATPNFSHEAGGGVSKANSEIATSGESVDAGTASSAEAAGTVPAPDSSATAKAAPPAGPAAIKVARRFADAFVLYEIGKTDGEVRSTFAATATPQVTHALLQRPPRQPAGTEVPKAKVLNIIPGPVSGSTYSFSVSLLRVGVTSELRIDMQRDKDSGKWLVTDSRG